MPVVLITGCSSGIGKASALAFARNGYRVYAGARNVADCADSVRVARGEGLALHFLQLDVTDNAAINAAVQRVINDCECLDVLINNAGITCLTALEDVPDAVMDELFRVNFSAPLRLSRAVLPYMRAQGQGRIIMVSSLSALLGLPGETLYSASKAALEAMAEGLRYEVERFNIRVSVVQPGLFSTALPEKLAHNAVCPEGSPYTPLVEHLRKGIRASAGRGADPHKVAELLLSIAAEEKPAFRYPAGAQAQQVTATIRELDDAARERFIRAVNDTAWWSAGEEMKSG